MIAINFMSSKDNDEGCAIHSKSDNTEAMINEKNFQSFVFWYQTGLKTSMKISDLILNCVHLLYYSN